MDETRIEAEWLKGLMSDLLMVKKPLPAITVHFDSMTIITRIKSSKYNQNQRRRIQVRLKFVRKLVSAGIIAVDFIGTKDNTVDPLTKGLALALVQKSRLGMELKPTRDS